MQKYCLLRFFVLFVLKANQHCSYAQNNCGCKAVRECYSDMIGELKEYDEASCISDAAIGTSTTYVYLKAISQFCSNITEVRAEFTTYEGRYLFEVIISTKVFNEPGKEDERPIFLIDAGQEAGTESVGFALYLIEQLVSCEENEEMISKVRWVILPSTNPDGQEYMRTNRIQWKKNLRPSEDGISFGVDISRNFEGDWKSCPKVENSFSSKYPGMVPASENETMFIQATLTKYRNFIKVYMSIRRDGHSLGYPLGYDSAFTASRGQLEKVASLVSTKVNLRSSGVHQFNNQSIYDLNGQQGYCGHSVDYAHNKLSIMYAFEMRVFLGPETKIITKFQSLPRGYESTLRHGYYSGVRELYNIIVRESQNKYY